MAIANSIGPPQPFVGPVAPFPQLIDPKVQGDPMVQALQNYLVQRNAYPIMQAGGAGKENDGVFQYGDDLPPQGKLALAADATPGTYAHELTHAALRQLVKQYYEQVDQSRTWNGASNPQFMDAYEKMQFRDAARNNARQIAPEWVKANEDYRFSPTEAQAWAVGNTTQSRIDPKWIPPSSPSHIDANMATQLAILLELAGRKQPGK